MRGPASSASHIRAYTMVEMIISMSIFIFMLGAVVTTMLVAQKCYMVVTDQNDLMRQSRMAKIAIEEELRKAEMILDTGNTPSYITFFYREVDTDPTNLLLLIENPNISLPEKTNIVSFVHDSVEHKLFKIWDDTNTTTLLEDCEEFQLRLFQREYAHQSTNTPVLMEPIDLLPGTLTSCQSVEVAWICKKYQDEERKKLSAEEQSAFLIPLWK